MQLEFYTVKVPRTSENTPEHAAQLLASLSHHLKQPTRWRKLFGHHDIFIALEISMQNTLIVFSVACPPEATSFLHAQLSAAYPDIVIQKSTDPLNTALTHISQLRLTQASYFPLRQYTEFKDTDPMWPLLGVMAKAPPNAAICVQMLLSPATRSLQANAYRYLHPTRSLVSGTSEQPAPEGKQSIEEKLTHELMNVDIRLATNDGSLLKDLQSSLAVLNSPNGNSIKAASLLPWQKRKLWQAMQHRHPFRSLTTPNITLNVQELASLWHMPNALTKVHNIAWTNTTSFTEPPEHLAVFMKDDPGNEDITFFANTIYKNKPTIFGLRETDRMRHVYVLGKSGSGKSTLLENMAIDDMKKGRGIAFLDPHGDSVEVLLKYIPAHRINDVVYFNPDDREFPISMNMLEVPSPDMAELVTSGIVSIFHKLYGHSWGPRLEYILRNTLLSLTLVPNSTLMDVTTMLTQPAFRKQTYGKLYPQLLSFWQNEFDKLNDKTRLESISPILNKVGQFVNSPLISNIIKSPKSTVDLADVMNTGKIFIANLSQGRLGEDNSALLGAMLTTKLQLAAMQRHNLPHEQRKPFFLYVDEFQRFATDSFAEILSEARKFKLSITLANQYTGQLSKEIQDAIFGNAGTVGCFVVGADDARIMESQFGSAFSADSLVNLQKHQIAMRTVVDGMPTAPFLATTLPPFKSTNSNKDKVIRVSRERWAKKLG